MGNKFTQPITVDTVLESKNIDNQMECPWCLESTCSEDIRQICDNDSCREISCKVCLDKLFRIDIGKIIPRSIVRCVSCKSPISQKIAHGIINSPLKVLFSEMVQCHDFKMSVYDALLTDHQIVWCGNADVNKINCVKYFEFNNPCRLMDDETNDTILLCGHCNQSLRDQLIKDVSEEKKMTDDSISFEWNHNGIGIISGSLNKDRIYFRKCPHCLTICNRDAGGCWHMTCYKCKGDFCWDSNKKFASSNAVYEYLTYTYNTYFPSNKMIPKDFYFFPEIDENVNDDNDIDNKIDIDIDNDNDDNDNEIIPIRYPNNITNIEVIQYLPNINNTQYMPNINNIQYISNFRNINNINYTQNLRYSN